MSRFRFGRLKIREDFIRIRVLATRCEFPMEGTSNDVDKFFSNLMEKITTIAMNEDRLVLSCKGFCTKPVI